ncbi:NADH-dependent dehydrogenase [Geomicrobium sp. JCM 19037]|uniref:Gfo/Idh/MocA family protein n=1 Tax=Geomicrobium sp. JCM 19037 TaxID=1460634 RepID=UPI00045F2AB2|nr:Gfo/Idh/MocA family oxidoreductase [Geomicrobium sp. JCM 19037]GAK05024.1 NADH-dependent dehydrogenase [Geomicrobium sp. JCM 19037]
MLHVVVIGLGTISEMHLSAYEQNPNVQLYGVCDVNEERAERVAEKYSVKNVFTDATDVFNDANVQAVSICTWNKTHAQLAIQALEAGVNVLVEKPLAMSVEEAEQIQEAERTSKAMLQVGYVRRFSSNAQVLKQFIDRGELGEVYYAKASYIRRIGNPGGWFADRELSGGGPLIDLGVHLIDLCWYMMDRPAVQSVAGHSYHRLGNRSNIKNLSFYKAADYESSKNSVEDLANGLVTFENGASMQFDVSYSLHAKEDEVHIKLYGTKGGAELEPELIIVTESENTILNIQPQMDHPNFHFQSAFQNQIDGFVSAVLNEEVSPAPVEDGIELLKIIEKIYE